MKIECIKGIYLDEETLPIMQGEVFVLVDSADMTFEAMEGHCINPGMEVCFTNKQLAENFKFIKG